MQHRSIDTVLNRPAMGGSQPDAGMHIGLAEQWAYDVDPKTLLVRGLTTNTLTDTFYASKHDVTQALVDICLQMARDDPAFLAKAAVWASDEGRALNNTAPNVALACLAGVKTSEALDWYARAFSRIIRTPLHLFEHVELLRKGNLGRKSLGRRPRALVRQQLRALSGYAVVKYRSRAQLRDLLRLTHPKPLTDRQQKGFHWIVRDVISMFEADILPEVDAYRTLILATDDEVRIHAIEEGNLAWEAVLPVVPMPSFAVWSTLLKQMPYMAMLRHLSAVSRHGTLPDALVEWLVARLTDGEAITKARILPFQLNAALGIYAMGGMGGRAKPQHSEAAFTPDQRIVHALEIALERSFTNWRLPGKVIIVTDVSGSMQSGYVNEGKISTYLDVAALFTAAAIQATDGQARVVLFDTTAREFDIRDRSFAAIRAAIREYAGGGTSMSAGIDYLTSHAIAADLVIGVTDSESWSGRLTVDSLREYRDTYHPRGIFLLQLAPYGDSLVPIEEPGIYQMAGWSPAVGQFISLMAAGHGQVETIETLTL